MAMKKKEVSKAIISIIMKELKTMKSTKKVLTKEKFQNSNLEKKQLQ